MNDPALSQSLDSDGSLYDLIEEITERLNQQEPVELEAVAAAHPRHASRLRQVWPSLTLLADLHHADAHSALSFPALTMTAEGTLTGVLGDFRLLREIGRGGMGIVYEAEQVSLNRTVALKVLPFAGVLDERQLQRFRNEARAAASLKHPHIVPVYAVGSERGVHYYAMELIEGRTLAAVIAHRLVTRPVGRADSRAESRGPSGLPAKDETIALQSGSTAPERTAVFTFREIAAWIAQAAEALDYAHSVGIIHRDIKPSNLLLDARGQVWITDFGLARFEADAGLTVTGDVLGTLRYMSPEQALGRRGVVDQRADVYSLGATLHELLTRAPLWSCTNRAELLRHIELDDPPSPRSFDGTIPAELETIVLKAIAKDPSARYSTAKEFGDDLRRFLEDRPIRARRPTLVERLRKSSRRYRTLIRSLWIAATISLLTAGLATVFVVQARHQTEVEHLGREVEAAAAKVGRANALENEYVNRINLTDRARRNGRLKEARAHLEACIPKPGDDDLRGFEWHLLTQMLDADINIIGHHDGDARWIAASPDGRWVASCGQDGIRIWDASSEAPLRHLTDHTKPVEHVSFSGDSKRLVSSSEEGKAIVWNTAGWSVEHVLQHEGPVGGGLFTPDGDRLLTAEVQYQAPSGVRYGENRFRLWDTKSWEPIGEFGGHEAQLASGDLSEDGKVLATGDRSGVVKVWNVPECRLLYSFRPFDGDNRCEGLPIHCIRFSHRTGLMLTGSSNSAVAIWRITDRFPIVKFLTPFGHVYCTAFSPDDTLLITGSDATVQAWMPLPDGRYQEAGGIRTTGLVRSICFRDSETVLAADHLGNIHRWNATGRGRRWLKPAAESVELEAAVSTDGKWLATSGPQLTIYDLGDLSRQTVLDSAGETSAVAFTPNGRYLISAISDSGAIRVWDVTSWQLLNTFETRLKPFQELRFLQKGDRLIVWSWSAESHEEWFELPSGRHVDDWSPIAGYSCVAQNTDLRTIRAVKDGRRFLDAFRQKRELWSREFPGFSNETFSDDGRRLAVGKDDGSVEICAGETGATEVTCVGTGDHVAHMAFSPDGRTLAAQMELQKSITLWHIATGRSLLSLSTEFQSMRTLSFSPDGRTLVVAGRGPTGRGEVLLFDAIVP